MSCSSTFNQHRTGINGVGATTVNIQTMAHHIVATCGIGKALDISIGNSGLIKELLRRGVDAYELDIANEPMPEGRQYIACRYTQGSPFHLPYADESFDTIVSKNSLEKFPVDDISRALKEIYRVTRRSFFLHVSVIPNIDYINGVVDRRSWWETRCMEAGFRKHPSYYHINDYEALNNDGEHIFILLEKIPNETLKQFPLTILEAERGLHMDMLRASGERSDAHVYRYHWACDYLKPGDRVLDAACGLGYGGHVMRERVQLSHVLGIDGSENAVSYATMLYGNAIPSVRYMSGMLPEALSSYEDESFDVIVSFETLEHVENPLALIREFFRLLAPGGRIIVSVPNDWSDETGTDPNPYHLHVYDWNRLKAELSDLFILEHAVAQTASRCKIASKGNAWESRHRSMHLVPWNDKPPEDCEWWLMTAMKSPLSAGSSQYIERVFANTAVTEHPSLRYADFFINPWLMHAMVNVEYRLKQSDSLIQLAADVTAKYPANSNDYAAALCILAYGQLTRTDAVEQQLIIENIDSFLSKPTKDAMALRWKTSLLFVKAKLFENNGNLTTAIEIYGECACIDIAEFGIHLATKTTEAAYNAGKLSYSLKDFANALKWWSHGVNIGDQLLDVSLENILINTEFPNLFNHGDGVREYSVAWDNIARCANGLHILHYQNLSNFLTLDNSHQTEYAQVTSDLIETSAMLHERTEDLNSTRKVLAERSEELGKALVERTEELVDVRKTLIERTEELVKTRNELTERTTILTRDLMDRTEELVTARDKLEICTKMLAQSKEDMEQLMPVPFYKRIFRKKSK